MSKYAEEQLKKCSYVNLNNYNSDTNTYLIPRYTKARFENNKAYLIKVSPLVYNNPNSVYCANWNKGTYPKYEYLKIFISKQLGKMIYVDALAYDNINKQDLSYMWSGWLPTEELEQLAKL